MKRYPLLVLLLIILAIFMIACGNSSNSSGSYASILIYNKHEYIGKNVVSSDQYPNKTLIGTISKQTNPDKMPNKNFSSNELKVGTKIYSLEDGVLGAEIEDSKLKLFNLKK